MTSWQQKLRNENEELRCIVQELRLKLDAYETKIKFLESNSKINSDLVETYGRMAAAMGESIHSMANAVNSIERSR